MNTGGEERASPSSPLFGRGAAAGHRRSERSSGGRRKEPALRSRVSTDLHGRKPAAITGSASTFLRRGSGGGGGTISACHSDTRHLHWFAASGDARQSEAKAAAITNGSGVQGPTARCPARYQVISAAPPPAKVHCVSQRAA